MTDEIERKPASENPWYVLMTIAGEQEGDRVRQVDRELHSENRKYWNGWMLRGLTAEQRERLTQQGNFSTVDLTALSTKDADKLSQEFQKRTGEQLPEPSKQLVLANLDFKKLLCCDGFLFTGEPVFAACLFNEPVSFISAEFFVGAHFADSEFKRGVKFSKADFWWHADFVGTVFKGHTSFDNTVFETQADFAGSDFGKKKADFSNAVFKINALFRGTRFQGRVIFFGSRFERYSEFASAEFQGLTDFSNTHFNGETIFANARFTKSPPWFFGATLSENTYWYDVDWPDASFARSTRDDVRAYERLKLLMDSQKKTHDEQMFHRMELRCREVEDGPPKNWPSRLYGWVSNYGWSIKRPVLGLILSVILGWAFIGIGFLFTGPCPASDGSDLGVGCCELALQLSISNTFGFLGLSRTVLTSEYEVMESFTWFEFLAGFQFFLGPVLLFFLFLALRNRYRMR